MTYGRTQWLVHMQRRGKDVSLILAKKSSKGLPSNQKTGWRVYSFSKLWKWIGLLSASFWSSPLYSTEYRNHRIRDAELGSHCWECWVCRSFSKQGSTLLTISTMLCCVFTASLGLLQMWVKQAPLWSTREEQEEMALSENQPRKNPTEGMSAAFLFFRQGN